MTETLPGGYGSPTARFAAAAVLAWTGPGMHLVAAGAAHEDT